MINKSVIEVVLRKNQLHCPSNVARIAVQLGGIEPFSDAADTAQVEQAIRQIRSQLDNPQISLEKFYDLVAPWLEVDANDQLILDAAGSPLAHFDQFRIAVHALGDRLVIREEYANAWRAFIDIHPEYDGVLANREIAFNALTPYTIPTAKAFEAMIADGVFVVNEASANQADEIRERASMIHELTAWMLRDGKPSRENVREYNEKVAKYNEASIEELRAYYERVVSYRKLKAAPVEEVRAIVKSDADASRNRVYERYQKLPLDSNGRPCYVPPGKGMEASVPLTKGLFARLPNFEQHRLMEHFGNDALTDAFAQHTATAARR
jgi:hypothetical protein